MKAFNKSYIFLTAGIVAASLSSCVSEAPFGSGEGSLSLHTEIRGEVVTRAEGLTSDQTLRDKCVIYIESSRGVVRKYIGLDNVPASPIALNAGHYVVEGWTGDSVSASFSSKFYRGKEDVDISGGDNKSLVLKCNIANVLVSVNPDVLGLEMKNLKVTFSHSRGSLDFTEANIATDKGYFMMPNADKNLTYKVTAEKNDGTPVERTGEIQNVERAHEYVLNITSDAGENQEGGALIGISIEDIPVINETIDIYGRPAIMGEGFDIADQVIGKSDAEPGTFYAFTDKVVYIRAYDGIYRAQLRGGDNFQSIGSGVTEVNLLNLEGITKTELEDMGVTWEEPSRRQDAATGKWLEEMRITFKKKFFDSLEPKPTEYRLEIQVRDAQTPASKSQTAVLRIATTDEAIEVKAPVETAPAPDPVNQPMAILARSATLTGYIVDETVTDYGIRYRKSGDSEWINVAANTRSRTTRAGRTSYTVTLTGLEPATTYEYQAYEASYDKCETLTFTTEGIFQIPNSSMEEWSALSTNSKITIPAAGGVRTFWDSGNHGSATVSTTLTESSTVMVHSGTYAARLESKFASLLGIGKMAAGNLFVGNYDKTSGTNGELTFGREYNGSHPTKLRVWANYRPGVVDKDGKGSHQAEGDTDQGQIYVALTTAPKEVKTADTSTLFNPEEDIVLAYGQVTWTSAFGPDGELQMLEIPLEYYERAKTTQAKYLVIVCSASKFGDYFEGAKGSVMYLDDFELVYE